MIRTPILLVSIVPGLLVSCSEKPAVSQLNSQAAFMKALVEVSLSDDTDAVKALVHPKITSQIDDDNRSIFVARFSTAATWPIAEKHELTTTAIPADEALELGEAFSYPVRPTLTLKIKFKNAKGRDTTILHHVMVDKAGGWWLVYGVPTEKMVSAMRERQAEADRIRSLAEALAQKLEAPLRAELKALIQNDEFVSAVTRYQEVSGEEMKMANAVINLLLAQTVSPSAEPGTKR